MSQSHAHAARFLNRWVKNSWMKMILINNNCWIDLLWRRFGVRIVNNKQMFSF
jgi:hypothetical protein